MITEEMKQAIEMYKMGVLTKQERDQILNEERNKQGLPSLSSFEFHDDIIKESKPCVA